MKKIYLSFIFLLLLFSFFLMSWTGPAGNESLEFPYHFYDYQIDFIPFDHHVDYDISDIEVIDNKIANLGRVLFYDKILSSDNSSSCASCHKQEYSFSDNKKFSEGINGVLSKRNTPNLNDLGWQSAYGFFWDFNSRTLEDAVIQPILNPDELGLQFEELIQKMIDTDYYLPLFEYAFDNKNITEEKIAQAISEFIKSMNTFGSTYDKNYGSVSANALTQLERDGFQLFQSDCTSCHQAPHFGTPISQSPYYDNQFIFNNGLDSIYTDEGANPDLNFNYSSILYGVFKAPSLRNLSYTAPYMHDGRFETIEEVIEFYSTGIQLNISSFGNTAYYGSTVETLSGKRGFLYSDEEKSAMLAFLKVLDDPEFNTDQKWSDPFLEKPVITEPKIENIKYDIYAYPNPVQSITKINISNSEFESYNLNLINMEGKLVRQIKTSCGNYDLERGGLPAGIYYLQIQKEDFKYSLKLLFL